MDISRHISTLLKFNECVIIPEFGGFISSYVSSRYDKKKNVFFPPTKEIVFNSKISKNDGLLISHVVEEEGIGYHDAQVAIANWVENSFKSLNKGGKISFSGVGNLEFDRFGSFVFIPHSENILLEAYGLKEFSMQQFSGTISKEYHTRPAVRAVNNSGNLLKVAAGIALLITLSIIPVRKGNFNFETSNVNPVSTTASDASVTKEESVSFEAGEKAETEELVETIALKQPEVKPFILVGGSFKQYENAHNFEVELRINGHHPEVFKQENGIFKVSIDSYSDKEEALNAMKAFRENHPSIGAWVSTR